ncbi:hypothetical protein J3R83DRAFT_218 [Lanmaoa asiatica]|nr:hypothetical protein J3R83DRAFT_218 [Lanmaoa asiatica]
MPSSSSQAQALLGSLGVSLNTRQGLVGLNCSPITAIGTASGAVCTQKPICCADTADNGAVNFNCSPVDVNL